MNGTQYQAVQTGPYETRLQSLYSNSAYLQNYANRLTNQWSVASQYSGTLASLGWESGKKAAEMVVQAGQQQAGVILMASAQAGITAASLREGMIEQSRLDQTTGRMTVGKQLTSYAGAGLSITGGSPALLIQETLDSNLRTAKSNWLSMASKEAESRQQKLNLLTESVQTEQATRQQGNAVLAKTVQEMMLAAQRVAG